MPGSVQTRSLRGWSPEFCREGSRWVTQRMVGPWAARQGSRAAQPAAAGCTDGSQNAVPRFQQIGQQSSPTSSSMSLHSCKSKAGPSRQPGATIGPGLARAIDLGQREGELQACLGRLRRTETGAAAGGGWVRRTEACAAGIINKQLAAAFGCGCSTANFPAFRLHPTVHGMSAARALSQPFRHPSIECPHSPQLPAAPRGWHRWSAAA